MKKIFALAFLLALVAVMVVPLAAFGATGVQTVGGSVTGGTITVTPASAIAFGMLAVEDSPITKIAATKGKVTVTPGTSGADDWTCVVRSLTDSTMKTGASTYLSKALLIAEDDNTYSDGLWYRADGPVGGGSDPATYQAGALTFKGTAGSVTDISFKAMQYVTGSDTTAGAYSITLTWTATLDVL